jgi:hypothetical protein
MSDFEEKVRLESERNDLQLENNELRRLLRDMDGWKAVILDELLEANIYKGAEHENNPRKALNDLIWWNNQKTQYTRHTHEHNISDV